MDRGRKTNITGNQLEIAVQTVLLNKGFEIEMYRKWQKAPDKYGDELLLKNVPYKTIYAHNGNTEFLLISKKYNLKIRIECKWQQVAGSVDEKLPYLYLNAIEAMQENDIIILIDGNGWKKGAITWLKKAVSNNLYTTVLNHGKNIMIFTLTEFFSWANDKF